MTISGNQSLQFTQHTHFRSPLVEGPSWDLQPLTFLSLSACQRCKVQQRSILVTYQDLGVGDV